MSYWHTFFTVKPVKINVAQPGIHFLYQRREKFVFFPFRLKNSAKTIFRRTASILVKWFKLIKCIRYTGSVSPRKKDTSGFFAVYPHTFFFFLNLQMPQNIIMWLKYNCLHKTRKFYSVFRILETVSYASWFGIFLHCNSALIWLRTVLYN